MKFLVSQLIHFAQGRSGRTNFMAIVRFGLLLSTLVLTYSILFHFIMEYEGRSESWITGLYWVLTVMSTLGFGDLTFHSDLGRLFSIVVLLSGIIFLLILLPFTFIEFFYEPWMRAQRAARAPTRLPEKTKNHVILIHFDAVTKTLISKLQHYAYPYVLLVADINEALNLHDLGYKVMLGDLDSPNTYNLARTDKALLVVATSTDQVNVNVVATVREVTEAVQIIATANTPESVDILELAGASHVLQLGERMGQSLARRVFDGKTLAHPIGQFDNLIIAEAIVRGTPLVGMTLRESALREKTGVIIMGLWTRGVFQVTEPDTVIMADSMLVLCGSEEHIAQFNAKYSGDTPKINAPVIILGGGRVGKATGRALESRGVDYRIVEKLPERARGNRKFVIGDAADIDVLESAGIRQAPAIVITTHDDDMNIYLTIYTRRLRTDAQIISRAGLERNIGTLHRSGADFVMSYASTGANAIINLIGRNNVLMVDEGLDVFEVDVPDSLEGKTIVESEIRKKTGCTIIGIRQNGRMEVMDNPYKPLQAGARMVLIGTPDAEKRFLNFYQ